MPPRMLQGGAVLVKGLRYDLEKVLDACDALVEVIGGLFAPDGLEVTKDREGFDRRIPWPDPGRAQVRGVWREAAKIYEAVDEALVFPMGRVTLKVYPLGKSWLVYHPTSSEILTPDGRPLGDFDPAPRVCVYGERTSVNGYRLASAADIALVAGSIAARFPDIEIASSEPIDENGVVRQVAFLRLPHASYGDGFGDIRARCVLPDGRELGDPSVGD